MPWWTRPGTWSPATGWTRRSGVTPEIARAKANAAAAFRSSTHDLEARFSARQLFAGNVVVLYGYQFVFGKGGVPILEDGRLLGAVGVSGAVRLDNDRM